MSKRAMRLCAAIGLTFMMVMGMAPLLYAQGQGQVRRIVVFDPQTDQEQAQLGIIQRAKGSVIHHLPIVNAMSAMIPAANEAALKKMTGVLRVEDDAEVYASVKPDGKTPPPPPPPPQQQLPWGVNRIDAEFAWDAGVKGAGINVAVLDTGIEYTHPDLAANCKGGINIINPKRSYADDNGHGTHVAGIIAARNNSLGVVGVAPEANLYAVKVLNAAGSGYISDIIKGLDWCINNKINNIHIEIHIINMSLGTSSNVQSFSDACDRAQAASIILVAAAGNSGGAVEYPGAYDSVIAVAATGADDQCPSWSCHGPEIALAAPGVNCLSTYKGGTYKYLSGTSMASPHVAGVFALQLSAPIHVDVFAAADDLGAPGVDDYYGHGLVDAGEVATNILNNGNN
ncbi:MAG: S8 family peptidase [Candidatus Sumerlaeota bacterium]|nr:S8 family peptidase [Candidatus Sumerlaeota bacterium]